MCVSAVTEEMIAEADVTVTTDKGVQIKIEQDGYVLSDNHYVFTDEWQGDHMVRQVSRLYSTGQVFPTNLTFERDYYAIGRPDVIAKGLGQMTVSEALMLLNASSEYKYVLTSSETDKWGYTKKATFREASKVQREAVEAKREEQTRQLAEALIR